MAKYLSQEDFEKINQIKAIIEKDYRSHYTQEQLAQKVSTNETKLRRAFKQVYNMTINEYLTKVRIEKAKELLELTNLPTKLIAYKVGYDTSNFYRRFKRVTKLAPLVWRIQYGNHFGISHKPDEQSRSTGSIL